MNYNEGLITEIFNNMNFEDKSTSENNSGDGGVAFITSEHADLNKILKNDRTPKSFVKAVESAANAVLQWKTFPTLKRCSSLYTISKALVDKPDIPSSLKNDFSILISYFDFYSDIGIQIENRLIEPAGVVLVILPPHPCFLIFGATVPAALAAGCSVIVHTEQAVIPLFLEEIIKNSGLPDGIFNVVTEPLTHFKNISKNIQKTIYCGSFSAAQDFYFENKIESFKFFSPNNTAALVLESCDLNSAVSKIFHKTWEDWSFWAVSTVVVQETIFQKFLCLLKSQMDRFLKTNSRRLNFENKDILEKINNVILKAHLAGATVLKATWNENEWGPTALVNYQSQDEDLPVLKILVCRTPKEGVKLLNNFHALGTSIWSEFSAQALEAASQLESLNIWVNCHGVVDARVPVSLSGLSGNFVIGGRHGVLEYTTSGLREYLESKCNPLKVSTKSEALEVLFSAKKAFDLWHSNKNKKKCFYALAESLGKNEQFSEQAQILEYLACRLNCIKFSGKNSTEEFFIVSEEKPVGVISLFLPCEIDSTELTFLIGLPVALGNAMILVMEKENSYVECLINLFNKNLSKNLLTVVYGNDAGLTLASDPTVQVLWTCNDTISKLINESAKNLKHTWMITKNVLASEEFFLMQCLRQKVIWLPKVEKFP